MTRRMWFTGAGAGVVVLLAGCAGPRVAAVDPEVRRAADGAAAAAEGGATERAVAGYEAALRRAALIDSPAEVARNAHNLAAVLAAAGRLADADRRIDQALTSGGLADAGRANALLLKAAIQRGRGNAEATRALADEAFAVAKRVGSRPAMVHARLLCAELDLASERVPAARLELALAQQLARRDTPAELRAWMERLEGVMRMRDAQYAEAASRFDAAAALLKSAGRYRDMADALVLAAGALEQTESWGPAVDRYLRAGGSRAAAGDLPGAGECLRKARDAAGHVPSDPALQARVTAWSGALVP